MRSRKVLIWIVGVCLGVLSPHPVMADELVVPDPIGDKGPDMTFDIVSASHGHSSADEYPRFLAHKVESGTDVPTALMVEENVNIRFNFDTKGDWRFDRSIIVQFTSSGTVADMWRTGYPGSPKPPFYPINWVGFIRVTRPDDRSVVVEFPSKLLGKFAKKSKPNTYRWMVEVYRLPGYRSFCGEGDASPCYDRTESVRHRL
jgi:hypothetical protein